MPSGSGWRVLGKGPWDGWELSREASDQGGGLRLDAGSEWVGRTLAFAGTGEVTGLRHLLLADGRLFRMVLLRPRNACFEIRGWETSGAYLVAHPDPGNDGVRWTLRPTPAAAGLEGIEAIQILFAAEIDQSDRVTTDEGPGAL